MAAFINISCGSLLHILAVCFPVCSVYKILGCLSITPGKSAATNEEDKVCGRPISNEVQYVIPPGFISSSGQGSQGYCQASVTSNPLCRLLGFTKIRPAMYESFTFKDHQR